MWTKVVAGIIFGKQTHCRLCFNEVDDDDLTFQDDVLLNMKTETISNMLTCVLGGKYTSNMTVSDVFCSTCIVSIKNCYNFIKISKHNSDCLVNIMDALNESLKSTESMKSSKSVLIHIDSSDFSYMQFYQYRRSVRNVPLSEGPRGYSKYLIARKKDHGENTELLNKNRKHTVSQDTPLSIEETVDDQSSDKSEENRHTNIKKHTHEKKIKMDLEAQHSKLKNIIQNKINAGSRKHILKMNVKSGPIDPKQKKQKNKTQIQEPKPRESRREGLRQQYKKKVISDYTYNPNILRKGPERPYKCHDCGKASNQKSWLLHHQKFKHSKEYPYVCKFCEMRFKVADSLRIHIRRVHLEPCAQCDLCDAKFREISFVHHHRKKHFNPKSKLYMPRADPNEENDDDGNEDDGNEEEN